MQFTQVQLNKFVTVMRQKVKPEDEPGWLHYRVLCDYLRESIKSGGISYRDLGLSGEIDLISLELECAEHAAKIGFNSFVEQGLIEALDDKLKRLHGIWLNQAQNDNIEAFFPDETDDKVA
jgi:hypothetical protein